MAQDFQVRTGTKEKDMGSGASGFRKAYESLNRQSGQDKILTEEEFAEFMGLDRTPAYMAALGMFITCSNQKNEVLSELEKLREEESAEKKRNEEKRNEENVIVPDSITYKRSDSLAEPVIRPDSHAESRPVPFADPEPVSKTSGPELRSRKIEDLENRLKSLIEKINESDARMQEELARAAEEKLRRDAEAENRRKLREEEEQKLEAFKQKLLNDPHGRMWWSHFRDRLVTMGYLDANMEGSRIIDLNALLDETRSKYGDAFAEVECEASHQLDLSAEYAKRHPVEPEVMMAEYRVGIICLIHTNKKTRTVKLDRWGCWK